MPNQKGVASPVFCRFSLFARSALKERGRPAHMFQPSGAGGLSLSANLREKISAVRAFVFFPIRSQNSLWLPSFAPAHVALLAALGRLLSQCPLACVPVSNFRFLACSAFRRLCGRFPRIRGKKVRFPPSALWFQISSSSHSP